MRSSIPGLKKLGFAECSRHALFQRLTVGFCAPSGPLPSPWALVLRPVLGQRPVLRLSLGAAGHRLVVLVTVPFLQWDSQDTFNAA
jgi:hypothetical protein